MRLKHPERVEYQPKVIEQNKKWRINLPYEPKLPLGSADIRRTFQDRKQRTSNNVLGTQVAIDNRNCFSDAEKPACELDALEREAERVRDRTVCVINLTDFFSKQW
jgi:hypothetical protein